MEREHLDFDKMYRDEHGNIPNFEYIVKKNLGILDNPKADAMMRIAWEMGHSDGYAAVYNEALDLVDLIEPNPLDKLSKIIKNGLNGLNELPEFTIPEVRQGKIDTCEWVLEKIDLINKGEL